jgi:hypothetical protein
MTYDTEYNAGLESGPDYIMGDDNNYRQISGNASKVGRCVVSEFKMVDGEPMGNKAWVELARAQDTPTNRQLLAYHTENALKWLVDNGKIKDLEVTTGDPAYQKGVGLLVTFTDVPTGDTSTAGFLAPWGKM